MIGLVLILIIILVTAISFYILKDKCIKQNYNNSLFYQEDQNELTKLIEMNRSNHLCNLWPPILASTMIVSFLLILFFDQRSYDDVQIVFDYLIVGLLVFVPLFFTMTWFQAHWFRERDDIIEAELFRLREELMDEK